MDNITTHGEAPNPPTPIELWDRQIVLKFFGGSKPLHVGTLYRGVAAGRYPKPVHVAGNSVRWIADECEAALQRMIDERDGRKRITRQGRHRLHRRR